MHCDQHVVKMPLEIAQMLCTALHEVEPGRWEELNLLGLAYKPTHFNHPCTLWVRACLNNYLWTAALGWELCMEYRYRFGDAKQREHKSERVILSIKERLPVMPRQRCITPFPLVMPEEYIVGSDPVASYRNYYLNAKLRFARWTGRDVPEWVRLGT